MRTTLINSAGKYSARANIVYIDKDSYKFVIVLNGHKAHEFLVVDGYLIVNEATDYADQVSDEEALLIAETMKDAFALINSRRA